MGFENREQESNIENTDSFLKAIVEGRLAEAETWLNNIKDNLPEKYDERWVDHRERELFQAYYKLEDWASAKRIAESSINEESKVGRMKKLAELAGKKYEEI